MQNASLTASAASSVIEAWASQMVVITSTLSGAAENRRGPIVHNFLVTGNEFVGFELIKTESPATPVVSEWRIVERGTEERYLTADPAAAQKKLRQSISDIVKKRSAKDAGLQLVNLGPSTGLPMVALTLPFTVKGSSKPIVGVLVVWQTRLHAALSVGNDEDVHLVNASGTILSSSKPKALLAGKTLSRHPLLKAARSGVTKGFKAWRSKDDKLLLGGYAHLPAWGLTAWTETNGEPAYDAIAMVVKRSVLWASLIVLAAIFFSLWAARGVTNSLKKLTAATVDIATGNFEAKATVQSRDEVGLLGAAVNHMGSQLKQFMGDRLEKARLETEMATAKLVQDNFIPKQTVKIGHLTIASHFEPATECGGDWWGHYDLGDDVHLICIADATGHGVGPALVTAMVFAGAAVMARQMAATDPHSASPAALLGELNRMFCSSKGDAQTMTFFAVIIDLKTGVLKFSNAGHNFPIVMHQRGERADNHAEHTKLMISGSPLGYERQVIYKDKTRKVEAGDRIAFYTDGLTECSDASDNQFGVKRLIQLMDASQDVDVESTKASLIAAAKLHLGDREADDDITLVMLEVGRDWVASANAGGQKNAS